MLKQYLEAGRIVATHGIRGEVRMEAWCDSAEFIRPLRRFYRADGSVMEVESSRVHKGMLLVKFKGVDTATQGDLLRGVVLSLDRNDVSLPQGRYFVQDLLGASVQDADSGRVYGKTCTVCGTKRGRTICSRRWRPCWSLRMWKPDRCWCAR